VVQTNTTIANGSFSAGDVVDIYMTIYVTYWDALSIAVEIEYGVAAGVTSGSIISLKDTGVLFGDTAPHSLSELYGEPFSGGTTAPASGTINLNAFNGETPPAVTITGFTIGTYSTTYLVPPVLSSTTQSNYTVSGHTGTNNLLKAFDRAAYSNYDSRTGGANSIDVIFNNNIYQGSATTWTGVATYDAPWIQVELPTARTVVGMVIRSEAVTNVGQKLRLLGSNDNTNWDLVFSTNTTINNPGGGRNNMNPIVIQFSSTTGSYKYYAYVWLGITATTGTYLARLAQFNLITQ
jgi:hypothetical protein